jgi:hypothetical protein
VNLTDIREAVAQRLSTVPGVRPIAYPADSIPTGSATVVTVQPDSGWVDYHEAFAKGLGITRLQLTAWVQASDMRAAMGRLDALASSGSGCDSSLADALMDRDRTLGGVCHDLVVDNVSGPRSELLADGARYLCADWSVRIYAGRQ